MNRQMRRQADRAAAKLGIPKGGTDWTPLVEVDASHVGLVGSLDAVAARVGCDVDLVREVAAESYADTRLYMNAVYEVQLEAAIAPPGWVHLTIRRRDGGITIPWQDKQRIKNELVGEECEAVELFPAESRLLDLAAAFHLWCAPQGERLPIGFDGGRTAT